METNLTEVYLDNSATTRCSERAKDLMVKVLMEDYGNPSSLHMKGVEAENYIKEAKKKIAKTLKVDEKEILFTSGGTESNNTALIGAALANKRAGNHIITTSIEHASVSAVTGYLEELGFRVTYLKVDADGIISLDELREAVCEDTILVSMMMVNNETGAVMPIREMIRATRRLSPLALFHTDAVQGFFKLPLKAKTLGADMISVSGHKIHAAKGVGALYIRPGLTLPPLIAGGGQESNYRSGTENLPGICGFGAACADQLPRLESGIAHMQKLRDLCRETLADVPGLVLLGKQAAPHIVNLSIPGLRSQGIINCLQDHDIYVSAGSACSRGHRSHVLEAMHLPPAVIDGSIRVSFSPENTEADVAALHDALCEAVRVLKG